MSPVRRLLGGSIAAVLVLGLAACGSDSPADDTPAKDDGWSYVSGDGKTYTADKTPKRIIAHAYAAAALMDFGIKPIAVYADGPIKEDVGLKGVDFSGIEVLGETWGKIDVAKAATLEPDLIVGDWWPAEKSYSGIENGVEEESKKIAKLGAPIVGPSQGDSIVSLIEGYEELAETLGADVGSGTAAAAKADFEKAVERFKEITAEKEGLTALAISPYDNKYAMAVPKYAPELLDFQSWGLDVIDPAKPDPEFPYWQTLGMEDVDQVQPDVLLFDDRNYPGNFDLLKKTPSSGSIKAFAAGAYTTWPAYWLHTYTAYAEQLNKLADFLEKADPAVA